MLGLDFDVDIDVKKVEYPVRFERKNVCVHCAVEGSLIFVDKWGHESNREINAFDHIKCRNCGRTYSILWQNDPNNTNKMYPTAVNPNIKREFKNILNLKKIKHNGNKNL